MFCADDERHDMFIVLSGLVGVISTFDETDGLVLRHTAGEVVGVRSVHDRLVALHA